MHMYMCESRGVVFKNFQKLSVACIVRSDPCGSDQNDLRNSNGLMSFYKTFEKL